MENAIMLQNVSLKELEELIERVVKTQLEKFRKEVAEEKPDELLTREETYKLLKIDSSTLWHWTKKGKVIAYGIGNRRYYKRSELLESLVKLKIKTI
jgi:hypothetical protein